MCVGKDLLYINFVNVFLVVVLFLSLKQFFNYFFGKKKDKNINFTMSFFNLLFCLICSLFKNIPLSILPLIFGLYLLLNSVIKFINYAMLFKNKSNGILTELILGIVYFIFAFLIIFSPIKYLSTVLIIIGIYTILLGINYIIDVIYLLIPKSVKNKIRRNFRISLPSIIEAIIPYTVLKEINYLLDKENYNKTLVLEKNKEEIDPDMEVFVHVAPTGYNRFGHVDICIDGTVISYGAYDFSTSKLFNMIGEGVIFKVDKEKYITYCTEYSNKTLFSFGLRLNKNQKDSVRKQIELIINNSAYYKTPYEKNKKKKHDDYPSKLVILADAKFYKVRSGFFKTFFVLGINCCKLANYILSKSGIDVLKITGIITPGAYYECLNREYQRKNSMVVSRKIYNNIATDKRTVKEIFKGFST